MNKQKKTDHFLILGWLMGSIIPRSRIYQKFATERVAISALTPIAKIDSASNRPSKPPTVRTEFPETWIWENLIENGFVKKSSKYLILLA